MTTRNFMTGKTRARHPRAAAGPRGYSRASPPRGPWLALEISRSIYYRRAKERALPLFPAVLESPAIARAMRFYVSPPAPDRCDALVAELATIIARGQARLVDIGDAESLKPLDIPRPNREDLD